MPVPQQSAPRLRSLDAVPFRGPEAARKSYERISLKLSASLTNALPGLLAESPDPDSAALLFERLIQESPETIRLLEEHPFLAHYAIAVFGTSWYLGETLIRNPDLLHVYLREKHLDRSCSKDDFAEALARFHSRSFERDPSLLLGRFKRREYVRIMLRDLLRIAPLAETTAEISALSDVLLEEALREASTAMQRRFGSPQHLDSEGRLADTTFSVLSLGKLGGNELNYSSDIDLLFLFGDGQEPADATISNREYFVRLAQQMTDILSRPTSEGSVFRIDLRLRPQGNEGELAVKLSHALRYYASTAHDWERQALIKVRYSAGDEKLARDFIRQIQPQVYKHEVNFAAIKTALISREKIDRKRSRQIAAEGGARINIKVDRGGIRDIEFLVQCLQRTYGGTEPWLRSGGTLFSLHKLHDKQHIDGHDFHELTSAYSFLRNLEHRLQLRRGQQVHRLPDASDEIEILRRSMEDLVPENEPLDDLVDTVQSRMAAVSEIYQRLIYQQNERRVPEPADDGFQLVLAPTAEQSQQRMFEKIAADAPEISHAISDSAAGSAQRRNLLRFLGAAFSTSAGYAELLRYQTVVSSALPLFELSEYLTEVLVRHPEEVATLAEIGVAAPAWTSGRLFNLAGEDAFAGQDPVFAYVVNSTSTHAEKVAMLRRHFGHRIFASGARDVTESRPVYSSLTETTAAAEGAINAAFGMTGSPSGLAVIALGRLGSREFDVLSDADLIFVGDENHDREHLTRAAEELMQLLSAYTQDGLVFPVDARLRPRGAEGELLVTPAQLETYFANEAQPWEVLMYTKFRFIAGDAHVASRAETAVEALFQRFAGDAKFAEAVREMRHRLELASAPERSIRTAPGALYDPDFLSGFLLVANGIRPKAGTLRDRLWRCAAAGVLEKQQAATLDHAAELFRTVEHVLRLVIGRNARWLPSAEHPRYAVKTLTSQILRRDFPQGLEQELLRAFTSVREIYDRVVK